MSYEMVQHLECNLDDARVAAAEEGCRRGGGKGRSSGDVTMQGKTEKKQEQTFTRRGFDVNASVARHKREHTDARVRITK
jgi:hypothetical protein